VNRIKKLVEQVEQAEEFQEEKRERKLQRKIFHQKYETHRMGKHKFSPSIPAVLLKEDFPASLKDMGELSCCLCFLDQR